MKVNVFLLKDMANLGKAGDIVSVKDGYAYNFIVKQQAGIIVTEQNKKEVAARKAALEKKKTEAETKTSDLAEKIKNLTVKIKKTMHEGDKLYGSIHATEIVDLLEKEGIKVSKSQIIMPNKAIKTLGTYDITVKLTTQLKPHFKLKVINS